MNASWTFACGLGITLVVALAVVRYLSPPLRKQLQELCGNAERAEFWTAFSKVTVVLTPAIFAMLFEPAAGAPVPPLLAVTSQLKWGLIGLVVSVLILGRTVGRFIPRTPASPPQPASLQKPGGAL
jgi:hypothetical protein